MPLRHFFYCIILIFTHAACGNHHMLKEVITLDHYPSASGMEYVNGQLFIIGDDANHLLILDSNLTIKDSIHLYDFPEKRIPKDRKADMESITLTADKKLLLIGSGSKEPYRNTAWLIDPLTLQKENILLDTFYARLKANNIHELNIEGSCAIPGYQLLSNRGSKGYPKNQLIFTRPDFWKMQSQAPVTALFLGAQQDSTVFNGVSGMAYASQSDRLLLTVSTEDTRNAMDDGAIGKSYLWMIKNISGKKRWSAVNPDIIIDLEEVDHRFKGQKIESVCIIKESTGFLDLLLAADNDNGTSTLFKVSISKE